VVLGFGSLAAPKGQAGPEKDVLIAVFFHYDKAVNLLRYRVRGVDLELR
jgi:hypothetical protein